MKYNGANSWRTWNMIFIFYSISRMFYPKYISNAKLLYLPLSFSPSMWEIWKVLECELFAKEKKLTISCLCMSVVNIDQKRPEEGTLQHTIRPTLVQIKLKSVFKIPSTRWMFWKIKRSWNISESRIHTKWWSSSEIEFFKIHNLGIQLLYN